MKADKTISITVINSTIEDNTNKEVKMVNPSQKSPESFEYLIKIYTIEGYMILDTCIVGGNTGVVSSNTNMRLKGIEITERYFNISKNRV